MKYRYEEISKKIATPSYLFDFDCFVNRCKDVRNIVGENVGLCYSMKANPFLIEILPDCIDKIEVCSPGELHTCEYYKINPNRIFYSGVNKNYEDISEAISYGVCEFTAESKKQLELINQAAVNFNRMLEVFIRVSSETQFGIDFEEVKHIIENRDQYQAIRIVGLHYFTGTQKKKTSVIVEELDQVEQMVLTIENKCGFSIEKIEYGTGLYVEYFSNIEDDLFALKEVSAALDKFADKLKLTIEMGRFFAASSGLYFTRIEDVKTNQGIDYLILDGGMNQLVYDGQIRAMKMPEIYHVKMDTTSNTRGIAMTKYTLCGSLCTSNDVIVKECQLNNPQIGDLLVFHKVGAYSFMEGMSIFLSREMPQIWKMNGDNIELLRDFVFTCEINRRQNNNLKLKKEDWKKNEIME